MVRGRQSTTTRDGRPRPPGIHPILGSMKEVGVVVCNHLPECSGFKTCNSEKAGIVWPKAGPSHSVNRHAKNIEMMHPHCDVNRCEAYPRRKELGLSSVLSRPASREEFMGVREEYRATAIKLYNAHLQFPDVGICIYFRM